MIDTIAKCMRCKPEQITNVVPMKAGMTNDSFIFTYMGKRYVFRTPGAGSSELINRQQEYAAYEAIQFLGISDTVVYYDKESGIKISIFIENAKTLDPYDFDEVKEALLFVKHNLHDTEETSTFEIDIISMIEKYEKLMGKSKYPDYQQLKTKIIAALKEYSKLAHRYCMCHFDLNPDNFLKDKNGNLTLLDWEYAGMNDPTFDLAGWIVYTKYNREQVDLIIDTYYEHEIDKMFRKKVYACIAAMGLLWSNWCEYKRKCGTEFGEYAEMQHAYAVEYSKEIR